MAALIDLTGQHFGRLTVVRRVGSQSSHATWLCQCTCGNEVVVASGNLRSGITKSCGCLHREISSATAKKRRTHGRKGTKEYLAWRGMRARCTNPNHDSYARYGGRGIRVCDEWSRSFERFLSDMGEAPSGDLSVDRIDPDGNYEPGNCRWATATEQARNKCTGIVNLTFRGKTQCVTAWAEDLGITRAAIYSRLYAGWDVERALTVPVRVRAKPTKGEP